MCNMLSPMEFVIGSKLRFISQRLTFVALILRRSFSKFKARSQRRRGIKEEEDKHHVRNEIKLAKRSSWIVY